MHKQNENRYLSQLFLYAKLTGSQDPEIFSVILFRISMKEFWMLITFKSVDKCV